jgi:hypothetical protein
MTEPDLSLIAFASDTVDVFDLADEMGARGWYIQPAHAFGGSREHIHITINASNASRIGAFIEDLEACAETARKIGEGPAVTTLLSRITGLEADAIAGEAMADLMAAAGVAPGTLPDRMADLNGILNHLPAAVREQLLIEFVNSAFVPAP